MLVHIVATPHPPFLVQIILNLVIVQSDSGSEKGDSQLILTLTTVTATPWSHDQTSGAWQPVYFYVM